MERPSNSTTTVLDQGLGMMERSQGGNTWYYEMSTPVALYNWELCMHLPMLLANTFIHQQQFDQARQAVKFVFDPTAGTDDASKVWRFLPFRELSKRGLRGSGAGEFFRRA